jgi:hypothetical protein
MNTGDGSSKPIGSRSHPLNELYIRKPSGFHESTTELSPHSVGDVTDLEAFEREVPPPIVTKPPETPKKTLRSKFNERPYMP